MLVRDSLNALHDFASRSGRDLTAADAETLVAVITDWYQSERATDAIDIDEDGDMLLFQWGSHDLGSSPVFYYDLTRQLIVNDSDDDDGAIWQLNCELRYQALPDASALGEDADWCSSPSELDDFRALIAASAATAYARTHQRIAVDIRFGPAG